MNTKIQKGSSSKHFKKLQV